MCGTVVVGLGEARRLGFPTLNLSYEQPCDATHGVYAAYARISNDDVLRRGVAVVGGNFISGSFPKVEIHLFEDFEVPTGASIEVQLCEQVSEMVRCESRDELISKIETDVAAARAWWDAQVAN